MRFAPDAERFCNGHDDDPIGAAQHVVNEPISPRVRRIERRRAGELAPRQMTFDPADARREAFARQRADLMLARRAAALRASLERQRTEPSGEKAGDAH